MLFYPSEREKGKKGGKRGREKGKKEEEENAITMPSQCRHNAQRAYEYYRMPWYINSCRRFLPYLDKRSGALQFCSTMARFTGSGMGYGRCLDGTRRHAGTTERFFRLNVGHADAIMYIKNTVLIQC